jgi:hypothetical protein
MRSGATLRRTGHRRRGRFIQGGPRSRAAKRFSFHDDQRLGIRVAAFVSSQSGATPLLADYLRQC